jgi:hypothetical protein
MTHWIYHRPLGNLLTKVSFLLQQVPLDRLPLLIGQSLRSWKKILVILNVIKVSLVLLYAEEIFFVVWIHSESCVDRLQ